MGIGSKKTVEIFEAQACWPEVEGACGRSLPIRNIMVLAKPGSAVAVGGENLTDGADTEGGEEEVAIWP